MKNLLFAVALLAWPISAHAQEVDNPIRKGAFLRDASGNQLGTIDRVLPGGAVRLIASNRVVTVPAATLSVENGRVTTSLTKKELSRLR